ncbi:hypothetical protein [Microvirga sp. VF16]|uniref:hypothetical protein n=1 Tax=Microvirga sp. VF16 TaxID=2807101 RepID=UPI00193E9044|nr:hypothetical protein [Microvirga sp. VF16]QRM33862.1 hypothetical protein JO965_38515 [Microvirga sp. VF16]
MTHAGEAHRWADQLDNLVARIAPRFGHIESRRYARAYLQDLLSPRDFSYSAILLYGRRGGE